MTRFLIGKSEYAWHNGTLFAVSDNGDTLLPPHEGVFAALEECDEGDAKKNAAVWEGQ